MVQCIEESYEKLKSHAMWSTLADSQHKMMVVVVFSTLFPLIIWRMDSFSEWVIAEYFEFTQ